MRDNEFTFLGKETGKIIWDASAYVVNNSLGWRDPIENISTGIMKFRLQSRLQLSLIQMKNKSVASLLMQLRISIHKTVGWF